MSLWLRGGAVELRRSSFDSHRHPERPFMRFVGQSIKWFFLLVTLPPVPRKECTATTPAAAIFPPGRCLLGWRSLTLAHGKLDHVDVVPNIVGSSYGQQPRATEGLIFCLCVALNFSLIILVSSLECCFVCVGKQSQLLTDRAHFD